MRQKTINRFYYKKDRLNQLRGFCTVVQNDCSATKASELLGLQSATIGQQIKTLEDQLNIELFDRNYTNKLVLTETGKKFYEMALPALQHVDGVFQNFIPGLEYERQHILNIASLDIVITRMIPFLVQFKKDNPGITISTFNLSKEDAFKRMKNYEIDLAFYPSNLDEEYPIELEQKFISDYIEYWVLYKGHPLETKNEKQITQRDMAFYPFIVLEDLIYIKSFANFVKEYNIVSPIRFRYGTVNMVKEVVKTKTAVSLLNETYLTKNDKKEFVLKNTNGNFSKMYYYYFINKGFELKNIAKRFLDIVKENQQNIFH